MVTSFFFTEDGSGTLCFHGRLTLLRIRRVREPDLPPLSRKTLQQRPSVDALVRQEHRSRLSIPLSPGAQVAEQVPVQARGHFKTPCLRELLMSYQDRSRDRDGRLSARSNPEVPESKE